MKCVTSLRRACKKRSKRFADDSPSRFWLITDPMKLALLPVLSFLIFLHAAALDGQDSLFESSSRKMQAGDYQGAETGFLQVLRSDPDNVSALGNLGLVYSHTQRS